VSAIVSDSSPLNYLALLSDFDLLRQLYQTLIIPPAVHEEVVIRGADYPVGQAVRDALERWIFVADTPDDGRVELLRVDYGIDRGESEAIIVAETLAGASLLMDERRGVRCARSRGLIVTRTPMIYANAKILGMIGSVGQKLDDLRRVGFRLTDEHYQLILKEAGEL
jgi:predicted nucleic acid-binding protein